MIEMSDPLEELRPRIAVIGVGGAGGNAVANMIRNCVRGIEFVAANTDAQALRGSHADRILQLGRQTTGGLGAGGQADLGCAAAEESLAEIDEMLDGLHMCFVAAGMGGGTGTGAAPIIARAARAKGILTVGVVTKPFAFEGKRRAALAEAGIEALRPHVDTLIVVPNQNLFRIASPATTFKAAFDMADEFLQLGIRGITDLMVMPGLINLDFADIRTVMHDMGRAIMGTGEASGDDRALRAAEAAIANPLLDEVIGGARGLIISISGGEDMRLMEVDEAAGHIRDQVDPDADIIWGSAFDPALEGRMRVSIIATGLDLIGTAIQSPVEAPAAAAPIQPAAIMAPVPVAAAVPMPDALPVTAPAIEAEEEDELLLTMPEPAPAAEMTDAELLLTVERKLVLVPPSPEAMAAAEAAQACKSERLRGPSLFERMATAARGAIDAGRAPDGPPLPHIYRGRDLTLKKAA